MGFVHNFKAALNGEEGGEEYRLAGKIITCPHCGSTHFEKSEAQLNTAGMTFLNLDFLNKTVDVLACNRCGHIEWFAKYPEVVRKK